MRRFGSNVFAPIEALVCLLGVLVHLVTARTPGVAYQCFVRLHCRSRGRVTDLLARLVAAVHAPVALPPEPGPLGALGPEETRRTVDRIREQGYATLPMPLPPALQERLVQLALTAPCVPRLPPGTPAEARPFDRAHPVTQAYDFPEQTVVDDATVQSLIADRTLLELAQQYLGAPPILSNVALWWSTAVGGDPEQLKRAAQLYHFDLDRVRWIKFFIYLTDVDGETGPHCFVARSHRTGGQPAELLRKGYTRLEDDEIRRFYPPEDMVEITGPRGSVIAVDTRGFHKGKPLTRGDRLILQLEYCVSMFGAAYQRFRLPESPVPAFGALRQAAPRVFARGIDG